MKRIVLFDGDCSFCNKSVQFIVKRDPRGHFYFASLQGEVGQELRNKYRIPKHMDSMILIEGDRYHSKSSAALRISRNLSGLWKLCYLFIVVPPFLRNGVYDYIAKRRYKWFGQASCELPTKELYKRMLD